MTGSLKPLAPVKDVLSVSKGRGNRLVIPQSLQPEMLNKLHSGHQAISKSANVANVLDHLCVGQPSVKTIGNMINQCPIC